MYIYIYMIFSLYMLYHVFFSTYIYIYIFYYLSLYIYIYIHICIYSIYQSPRKYTQDIKHLSLQKLLQEKLVPCQRAALYHVRTNATASHEARLGAS